MSYLQVLLSIDYNMNIDNVMTRVIIIFLFTYRKELYSLRVYRFVLASLFIAIFNTGRYLMDNLRPLIQARRTNSITTARKSIPKLAQLQNLVDKCNKIRKTQSPEAHEFCIYLHHLNTVQKRIFFISFNFATMARSANYIEPVTLENFPCHRNRSTLGKPTTFGTALTSTALGLGSSHTEQFSIRVEFVNL